MKAAEARDLGARLAALIEAGEAGEAGKAGKAGEAAEAQAVALLRPVLGRRVPFPALGIIGGVVGGGPLEPVNAFLDRVVAERAMGGWVVIGAALRAQLARDPLGALQRARDAVVAADVWYGADILGERVPGQALVDACGPTLARLRSWRTDENRWVRRAIGVAVHVWAKRARGRRGAEGRAILTFLEPMLAEADLDAVKGIGWGLKTIGQHAPDLLVAWLARQVARGWRPRRQLLLDKALTYLTPAQRRRAQGDA
jgi:hypothetical protein